MDEIEARLLANRSIEERGYATPCWIWTKSCQPGGYGQTTTDNWRTNRRVHRIAAALWLGFDLESSLCVLHRCDVPACFNPDHLFVGTRRDNTHDMIAKGRAPAGRRGETSPAAKLSDAQVHELRRRRAEGTPYKILGRDYGITIQHASRIYLRKSRPHT